MISQTQKRTTNEQSKNEEEEEEEKKLGNKLKISKTQERQERQGDTEGFTHIRSILKASHFSN